jgi:hypothetical protein
MNKALLNTFLVVLIPFLCFGQYQKSTNLKQEFLGNRFKDYNELQGLKKINSTVINLHYGVAHLQKNDKNLLLLSKFENSTRHQDDFELKVIDVVEVPNYNTSYYALAVKGCSQNGRSDVTLFALVVNEDSKKYLTRVIKVWKLNKETGRITDFPNVGIRCLNAEFDNTIVSE